ncbi:MAG: sugar phosphate isomerase/epimerase family protein [Actinomycetota bacterium]
MTPPHPAIQCSTGPFWAFELAHAMDALAEAGFKEIELMVTRDPVTQKPEIPGRLAKERGLKISSLHAPFLVITKNVWGLDPVGKIRRGAEMCRELGSPSMIVHPPYLWERAYADWVMNESEGFSEETGVAVAVETMYPKWVAGRKLRAYRWLEPHALAEAAPHAALDTSHLAVCREDILKGYDVLRPTLRHIHLSDNAADGRDGHLELEQGVLPLERFLGELRRTRYSGAISLEISVRRYLERHEDLVKMLRRNKEYVEKQLSGSRKVAKGLPRP